MWGKILGFCFGFMFGKIFGAILGLYLGHLFDKSLKNNFDKAGGFSSLFSGDDVHERQALFFSSCFAVMGHIAKSNGRVSEIHIKAANLFMDEMGLKGEERREAQHAFQSGKESDFSLKETVHDFKERFAKRNDLIQLFLEIQIQMAFSDGVLAEQEKQLLAEVSKQLGISKTHFAFVLKRYQAEFNFRKQQQRFNQQQQSQGQSSSYREGSGHHVPPNNNMNRAQALALLGLNSDATQRDIKVAYRKLMSQHHPDKLVSQGLPKHMMELAVKKSQDIQAAYEYLKKSA
ncbi:co-chaperone DjlA [Pseudoalteromonas sp. SR43-6]|jgi:DnaJ like chaperone protein|uniref:Co-chaperone protein DjlA n=1 Tax=Pseudoalteromonas distincta TaxID=77608 RepID=F3BL03_9GAMM|nr:MULTISPECIES: co-chaperone DjlA [Pseudoalteromonas]EGI72715.1 DnaJ-like protein DjlA [Pseudoalteromonas distincta]KAA1162980.1 co-chaperone DjlA [Pseudoalteromonas distincta]KHM50068.1 molecular chaperone DnaJ [Pseudoalteromonas elyakovii]KID40797.1 molecular chaperone DnaJ [Pseudoalteromonas distincta]MBB1288442.1 co-chaperone DjlA [Pseudoalteromonas sp. SR41-5]|tara:strand:+ start:2321 stop:3187 length:867 start_codon:yes stop_codon:yes gene_type:complete